MNCKQAAKDYLARGLSVIPVGKDKKPLGPWKEFQSRKPTEKEIDVWPAEAQVGIVTGRISNLSVIDIDSETGEKKIEELIGKIGVAFKSPCSLTPRGGKHLYCQYHAGFGNNVRAVEGVDLRSEGGFVVAPPSANNQGKFWTWLTNLDTPRPALPQAYAKAIIDNVISPGFRAWAVKPGELLTDGRRNNDLFHILYHMAKGGERGRDLERIALDLGRMVGLGQDEIKAVLSSVTERVTRGERNLSKEIGDWVDLTEGVFNLTDLRKDLQILTPQDKNVLSVAIHRLKDAGIIEVGGKKNGEYRRIVRDCEKVDWLNSPTEAVPLDWPLELGKLAMIYPKSIVVIAGKSNAGKTSFLLDLTKRNMKNFDIHYFSSEMGGSEAKVRLALHEDIDVKEWNFSLWDRASNFGDVIQPNAINIIDYLEDLTGEEYKVKAYISQIWSKLDKGVAIIALQKNEEKDIGRGGQATLDRARLYLAMNHGIMKVVKAKAWAGRTNPNGLVRRFKLVQGWKFIEEGEWMTETEMEFAVVPKKADKDREKRKLF